MARCQKIGSHLVRFFDHPLIMRVVVDADDIEVSWISPELWLQAAADHIPTLILGFIIARG